MSPEDLRSPKLWKGFFAEFLATTLFVFLVCSSTLNQPTVLRIAFTAGLAITTMVFCIGPLSGGHINPVVSLAFMARRKIPILTGLLYIVAQFLGAILGSALLYGTTPPIMRGALGVTSLAPDVSPGQAVGVESVLTFILLLTIFTASDSSRKLLGYEVALAIGVAVFICHSAGIPFTGSSLNPARSFGPAVVMNFWKHHWVYWVGPIVGSLAGAFLYDFVLSASSNEIVPSE